MQKSNLMLAGVMALLALPVQAKDAVEVVMDCRLGQPQVAYLGDPQSTTVGLADGVPRSVSRAWGISPAEGAEAKLKLRLEHSVGTGDFESLGRY